MTLTEFLLARIAEDESDARKVEDHGRWSTERNDDRLQWWIDSDLMGPIASTGYVGNSDALPLAEHIARHDPARVLAECKAKREIVERAIRLQEGQQLGMRYVWQCVADLASVYADHPDYNEAVR